MVLKTTFGQSQRLSLIRGTLCVENEEMNILNFAKKVFNRSNVLSLGGLNSGISLYIYGSWTENSAYNTDIRNLILNVCSSKCIIACSLTYQYNIIPFMALIR